MGLFSGADTQKSEQKKESSTMGERLMQLIFCLFVAVVLLSITVSLLERIWVWLVVISIATVGIWIFFRRSGDKRDRW